MNNRFSPAKRENNSQRDFIIINRRQAKHFPAAPHEAESEFSALAELVAGRVDGADIVVIGFAETAVALGAYVAEALGGFYISTTREPLPAHFGRRLFSERHSHATEHTLCVRDDDVLRRARAVVLVDDEYTTGRTAAALADSLRGLIQSDCRIIAAALCASAESARLFAQRGIELCAAHDFAQAFGGREPSALLAQEFLPDEAPARRAPDVTLSVNALYDARRGTDARRLFDEAESLCGELCADILPLVQKGELIEIIGTEELCLPPLILGRMLEERGYRVLVHGQTRSPMLPSAAQGYPIRSRHTLSSLYDPQRRVYLYNSVPCALSVVMTDAPDPSDEAVETLCGAAGGARTALCRWRAQRVRTSILHEDAEILLKDITGRLTPLPAREREPLIRSGVHYSELLPAEYEPSEEYLRLYKRGLSEWAGVTAAAVERVSRLIMELRGRRVALVSLARAGTPVGVLIKRCIKRLFGVDAAHYSISIVRGRGIDRNAMRYILARHSPGSVQFVDGWTGKGAIVRQLEEALAQFPENERPDSRAAVLSDPAGLCDICGTHDDIFLPCSCLNSVVSGLFSRTVLRPDLIGQNDFHGAHYFAELAGRDRTYEFINAVESRFGCGEAAEPSAIGGSGTDRASGATRASGANEALEIAQAFGVEDINLVKPSIGETTRVLLRRIPRLVLLRDPDSPLTAHIRELAAEKGVEVRQYPLRHYRACGIIAGAEL